MKWQVPKWKGALIAATTKNAESDSKFLQVSESSALSWAHRLGLKFSKRRKGYYVDGHDRKDVLQHRKQWLQTEKQLELRQYLWIQMYFDDALKIDGNDGFIELL